MQESKECLIREEERERMNDENINFLAWRQKQSRSMYHRYASNDSDVIEAISENKTVQYILTCIRNRKVRETTTRTCKLDLLCSRPCWAGCRFPFETFYCIVS